MCQSGFPKDSRKEVVWVKRKWVKGLFSSL